MYSFKFGATSANGLELTFDARAPAVEENEPFVGLASNLKRDMFQFGSSGSSDFTFTMNKSASAISDTSCEAPNMFAFKANNPISHGIDSKLNTQEPTIMDMFPMPVNSMEPSIAASFCFGTNVNDNPFNFGSSDFTFECTRNFDWRNEAITHNKMKFTFSPDFLNYANSLTSDVAIISTGAENVTTLVPEKEMKPILTNIAYTVNKEGVVSGTELITNIIESFTNSEESDASTKNKFEINDHTDKTFENVEITNSKGFDIDASVLFTNISKSTITEDINRNDKIVNNNTSELEWSSDCENDIFEDDMGLEIPEICTATAVKITSVNKAEIKKVEKTKNHTPFANEASVLGGMNNEALINTSYPSFMAITRYGGIDLFNFEEIDNTISEISSFVASYKLISGELKSRSKMNETGDPKQPEYGTAIVFPTQLVKRFNLPVVSSEVCFEETPRLHIRNTSVSTSDSGYVSQPVSPEKVTSLSPTGSITLPKFALPKPPATNVAPKPSPPDVRTAKLLALAVRVAPAVDPVGSYFSSRASIFETQTTRRVKPYAERLANARRVRALASHLEAGSGEYAAIYSSEAWGPLGPDKKFGAEGPVTRGLPTGRWKERSLKGKVRRVGEKVKRWLGRG